MQKYHINGIAIALINHGKKSIYVFGKTNQGLSITQKSMFQLGSITKTFTTLLLSEEIENKNITLFYSVTNYLTDFSKNNYLKKITVENLATFTSGLPFNQPDSIITKKQLQDYLLHLNLNPENKWQYSNMSIGLLSDALCAKENKSLAELFKNNIFISLQMNNSNLNAQAETEPFSEQFFQGAWALQSNIVDMSHYLSAAIGLPGIPQNILQAMRFSQIPRFQVGNMKQALAWQVFSLKDTENLLDKTDYMNLLKSYSAHLLPRNKQKYNANALIDKTGMTHQFESYIAVIPSQQSGIVILINNTIAPLNDVVKIGREVLLKAI